MASRRVLSSCVLGGGHPDWQSWYTPTSPPHSPLCPPCVHRTRYTSPHDDGKATREEALLTNPSIALRYCKSSYFVTPPIPHGSPAPIEWSQSHHRPSPVRFGQLRLTFTLRWLLRTQFPGKHSRWGCCGSRSRHARSTPAVPGPASPWDLTAPAGPAPGERKTLPPAPHSNCDPESGRLWGNSEIHGLQPLQLRVGYASCLL